MSNTHVATPVEERTPDGQLTDAAAARLCLDILGHNIGDEEYLALKLLVNHGKRLFVDFDGDNLLEVADELCNYDVIQ